MPATAVAAAAALAKDATGRSAEVFAQAEALDEQMEAIRSQSAGKVIVFYGGRVLCSGDTEEEAIERIPDEKRGLPLVIRRITAKPMVDFMGGPKGE